MFLHSNATEQALIVRGEFRMLTYLQIFVNVEYKTRRLW